MRRAEVFTRIEALKQQLVAKYAPGQEGGTPLKN
jgi:hypothetical protein